MSASANDLCAAGIPAGEATLLGLIPVALTCTGTSAGTAAAVTGTLVNLTTAGSQTGAILPAFNAGRTVVVGCPTATSAVIYPPTGATINGASSLTLAQNKVAIFYYYSTTVIFSILTA